MNPILTVAVVGAGTMGQGIAHVAAATGYQAILFDVNTSQSERALLDIEKALKLGVEKGRLTQQQLTGIMSRIRKAEALDDLRADIIIEAAIEKLQIKQELFQQLEKINGADTILTSNTSSLSISQIFESLENQARCAGLHFFNPADRMRLVEIVVTRHTAPAVVARLVDFAASLGKTPVTAKDSPGFIVNRVARHFYVESLKLLEENAGDVGSIDRLMRSAGFKMGPFELMDLIGVDINFAVTQSIYQGFNNAHKFKPSQIQQRLVEEGHLGRKSGKGFYEYTKK